MVIDIAMVGYAAAALAFAALAVLLLVRGAPNATGRLFVAAVMVESLWSASIAAAMARWPMPLAAIALSEAARLLLWLLFLVAMLKGTGDRAGSGVARVVNAGVVGTVTIAAAVVAIDLLAFGGRAAFIAKVVAAVFGLMCLEQLYRNTPASSRWSLKFLAIALLALFGFDLVMYSEALLFSRMNPALWGTRGYANALLVPLLAIAAARNREWKLDISVSRQVVFHSATLFVAGVYLILMAAGGYWVRLFGGEWGEVAQALVVFGALIGLAVALGSGTVRARMRVFVAKHFFSYRYDYRAEWLRLTELLADATTDTPLEQRAVNGLATLVESGSGAIWLAGEHGSYQCAARWQYHGEVASLAAAEPLVELMRSRQWIVDLDEWREHPSRYDDLRLPNWLGASAENWLIVPLLLRDTMVGFILIARPLAKVKVDWEVRDALKAAARQVAGMLEMKRAVEALVQARQFDSFNRMSAFVVHDLKNLVAQLSLLMGNAQKHGDNPEFHRDMIDTVENVLARMRGLLMQLRSGTTPIEKPARVRLAQSVQAAVGAKRALRPQPQVALADGVEDALVRAHGDRLERVIGHLVQNAAEAVGEDGHIWVRARREGGHAVIEVQDDGHGMSEGFIRDSLFRPFASTKEHGMGIGTFESREYIREMGGRLEVISREHEGTTFRIVLPLEPSEQAA